MVGIRPAHVSRGLALGLIVAAIAGRPAGAEEPRIPTIREIILDLARGSATPPSTDEWIRECERRATEPGVRESDLIALGIAHCKKASELDRQPPSGGDPARVEGHRRRALSVFEAAVATNPASPEAHGWLAYAHTLFADHSNAIEHAGQSVRLGPTQWTVWFNCGVVFAHAGRDAEAIEAYTAAIRLRPEEPGPRVSLARLYDRAGRPGDVVAVCGQAPGPKPPVSDIVDVEAKALVALGRAGEAAQLCRARLERGPKIPQIQYRLAQALAALGDFDEAIRIQTAVKMAEPVRCDPYNEIGNYLGQQGRWDAACREYRRGLAVHRSCPMISRNLSLALLRMGQPAEAITVLEEAWAAHPETLEVCGPLADAYEVLGRTDKAEEACRRGIAIDPLAPEPRLTLARLLLELGSLEESVMHSREGLERAPRSAAGWQNLGGALVRLKRFGEAAEAFRRGTESGPEGSRLWIFEVGALREGGRLEDALERCRAATVRFPTNAGPWNAMGDLYVARRETDRAVEAYLHAISLNGPEDPTPFFPGIDRKPAFLEAHRQAVRTSPSSARCRARLAGALLDAGSAAEACKVLEEGLARQPDDLGLLEQQGRVLLHERKFEEAVAVLERGLKTDSGASRLRFHLARACREMGRTDLAIQHWEIITQTDNSIPSAYQNLGFALAETGRHQEALESFRRYVEAVPADASGHCSIGYTCYKLGMYDEALGALSRSIALDPRVGIVHYDLALVLHEKGRNREAAACCERARALGYPGRPEFVQRVRDAAAREAAAVAP